LKVLHHFLVACAGLFLYYFSKSVCALAREHIQCAGLSSFLSPVDLTVPLLWGPKLRCKDFCPGRHVAAVEVESGWHEQLVALAIADVQRFVPSIDQLAIRGRLVNGPFRLKSPSRCMPTRLAKPLA
jgi:hypothetical protein